MPECKHCDGSGWERELRVAPPSATTEERSYCQGISDGLGATLPCGHPASCDTGSGCGWCAALNALRAMLEVHDNEPCYHDHHGLCQAHNLRRNEAGEPECQVALAREVLQQQEPRP